MKKMFLEISQNSLENTCSRVLFLIKLQGRGLQLYHKRDSGTGVRLCLWIYRNLKQKQRFYVTQIFNQMEKKLGMDLEAVAQKYSVKKVFSEILQNSQENICASLFFNKVASLMPATY